MALWLGALNLGLLYAFMTMGVFVTFRIYDFPDITVDGSFTSGAAAAAVLIVAGANPFWALAGAFAIGAAAGSVTAVIHTKLNVNGLLAGILVMTALYSLNLHVMGRSNIPLLNERTFLFYLERTNPGLPTEVWIGLCLCAAMLIFALLAALFLKTDLGIAIRAAGNNRQMAAANGVNVGALTIFGVALSNGMVGVSGGLVAQYQGFSDIGMGIGTIVIGLASVILGESVLRRRSLFARVIVVIVGSVLFRFMIALALYAGMNPIDLKLLTATFVLLTIGFSKIAASGESGREKISQSCRRALRHKSVRIGVGLAGVVGVIGIAALSPRYSNTRSIDAPGKYKIGLVQIVDHGLLNVTRDAFVKEMERIGYRQGENVEIILKNANGDIPTVSTILDSFVVDKVDVVVPISTPCTQAAINKIKDRPVVFATVANPFIIGVGKTDADHLPNVTGVYGWIPMNEMLEIARKILPGKLTVGAIWNPAHANSVFNVEHLQEAIETYDDVEFKGATITSSSEVYEAAVSLVEKDINVFVLSPDNIVYSAFESVVKAARKKGIPIFLSDVERLADGALGALGYDYSQSGVQAAHLVDRVLKGEGPGDIPFERYDKRTFGLNLEVARELGITLPRDLIAKATTIHGLHHFEGGSEISDDILAEASKVMDSSRHLPAAAAASGKRLASFDSSSCTGALETAEEVVDKLLDKAGDRGEAP